MGHRLQVKMHPDFVWNSKIPRLSGSPVKSLRVAEEILLPPLPYTLRCIPEQIFQ